MTGSYEWEGNVSCEEPLTEVFQERVRITEE